MHIGVRGHWHFLTRRPDDVGGVHVALELVVRIVGGVVRRRRIHKPAAYSIGVPVERLFGKALRE